MISFEFNQLPHNITNDQLNAVVDMINEYGWGLNYDIVEGEEACIWLWAHPFDEAENPTRIWIDVDGQITLQEEVTWDWKGTS
jgi:hypothetical protein